MRTSWLATFKSFFSSITLHVVIIILLVISVEFAPEPKRPPQKKVNIINAVSVDKKQVEQELKKLKQAEEEKKQAEEKRKKDLEKKAKAAEEKRKQEEKKIKDLERKKAEEKKRLKIAEQKKKEEEAKKKKLAEEKKKKEAEKKRKAEAEKKRLAEEKRKKEEELKRQAEKKKKEEEERRRKHEEELLLQELEEEQLHLEEAQNQQDLGIISQYTDRIKRIIEREFNTTGLDPGLSCILQIRMVPSGDVVNVLIAESSGNDIFDRRAQTAVEKASPLPVPDESRIFEKMREIRFTFEPEN